MDLHGVTIRHITYPLWLIKNGKYNVLNYWKEYERSQYMNKCDIEKEQFRLIKILLQHAYDSCPFYRERFDNMGIMPNDVNNMNDYQKIPVLKKQDIQDNYLKMKSNKYDEKDLVPNRTGGSTGSPLRFYHDRERTLTMQAATMRHFRWAGYNIGDKLGIIWGNRQDIAGVKKIKGRIRDHLIGRSMILDSSSITEEKMQYFANSLRKFRPKVIQAYANAMYIFAQYCKENSINDIRPYSILTSAEVLHQHERNLIEEVFSCKVFDYYGCREVSTIATECEKHTGMHINAESLYVEFINDMGNQVNVGEPGKIIITDLLNYGMPFIRYQIEDIGVLTDNQCQCGRGLPMMEMVAGRTTDFIVTPNGTKVSGSALTIYLIAAVPGIRQAQIIQDKKDHLIFNIVKKDEFNKDGLFILKEKVEEYFGKEMNYDIKYVDNIPKEPSGKYRFSISKLQ